MSKGKEDTVEEGRGECTVVLFAKKGFLLVRKALTLLEWTALLSVITMCEHFHCQRRQKCYSVPSKPLLLFGNTRGLLFPVTLDKMVQKDDAEIIRNNCKWL